MAVVKKFSMAYQVARLKGRKDLSNDSLCAGIY